MGVHAIIRIMAMVFSLALFASSAPAADALNGQELANSLGCRGCHRIGGDGGNIGPPLDGIGKRMPAEKLRQWLLDPKSVNPKSMMPSFQKLTEADLRSLTDYLLSLK